MRVDKFYPLEKISFDPVDSKPRQVFHAVWTPIGAGQVEQYEIYDHDGAVYVLREVKIGRSLGIDPGTYISKFGSSGCAILTGDSARRAAKVLREAHTDHTKK